jgi:AraC-like DNA-binding protein
VLYFFFLGIFQSLMAAFILLKKANKRPADIFLLLLVACFTLHSLASFLLYELTSNPYFRKGFMNFTFLAYGPLVLLYVNKIRNGSKKFLWLLAPSAIWAIPYCIILGFWLTGSSFDVSNLQLYNRSLLIIAGPLNIGCFYWAHRISRILPEEELPVKNLVRIASIAGIVSVTFCLSLTFYILYNDIPYGLFHQLVRSTGICGLIVVTIAIARYALVTDRPRVFAIHAAPKTPRPSLMSKERLKEIYDELATRVQQERLFLDPDLNMEKLTTATGYSRHQISEVLNQYADISFYSFINRFRVEQVCEQMKKAAAKTSISSFNMIDLSYACGFKSKSTFNEYFRRFTELTPSQYWSKLSMEEKKV